MYVCLDVKSSQVKTRACISLALTEIPLSFAFATEYQLRFICLYVCVPRICIIAQDQMHGKIGCVFQLHISQLTNKAAHVYGQSIHTYNLSLLLFCVSRFRFGLIFNRSFHINQSVQMPRYCRYIERLSCKETININLARCFVIRSLFVAFLVRILCFALFWKQVKCVQYSRLLRSRQKMHRTGKMHTKPTLH